MGGEREVRENSLMGAGRRVLFVVCIWNNVFFFLFLRKFTVFYSSAIGNILVMWDF